VISRGRQRFKGNLISHVSAVSALHLILRRHDESSMKKILEVDINAGIK
jgi:hypothetical protein